MYVHIAQAFVFCDDGSRVRFRAGRRIVTLRHILCSDDGELYYMSPPRYR